MSIAARESAGRVREERRKNAGRAPEERHRCIELPIRTITGIGDSVAKICVVPAKAGTQWRSYKRHWIPAFAGMTM